MGPHTHTLGSRDGSGRERWCRPRRSLPVSTRTRCSSWFFSSSWASICRSLSSMLPCLSSACRPRTGSVPLAAPRPDGTWAVTTGAASGPCSMRTMGPGFAGGRPHTCSRRPRGFACDTWVTEGLRVASQRGQQAAASAGRARHTLYLPKLGGKFEQFSLLSGRASGRQKVRLQGRPGTDSRDAGGKEKPSLERKITGRRAPPGGC